MIDILLAFDNDDINAGIFLTECRDDILNFFNGKVFPLSIINSNELNHNHINKSTSHLKSFIFVTYCHGNETCLAEGGANVFLSETINISNFSNTFFYTVSCSSGHTLGHELIKNGCKNFFGYKEHFNFYSGFSSFLECANHGLFLFINGESTDNVYSQMIQNYDYHIKKVYKTDPVIASLLLHNKNALVKIGKNITINDLII
ncbi:hypothetical protein [Flavobacterium hercynium]|uniref:CHAT domain-containing protein n=1 Tax=Flavobacterium hercynium TaxID=387094 RepID=A0A226HET9_9FLAO|nr:hypothetical protein [Flavobacterium hercynium]OXA92793.1 hypothetical protein B0A66_08425 [Flavobacterium hercynium]SMP02150.1 hypothetical protein SAMN06265346_101114 [Flavobacterium hercynium]